MTSIISALVLALVQAQDSRVDRLIRGLHDASIEARHRAAEELRSIGDAAVPPLERALSSADPEVQDLVRALLRDAPSGLIRDLRADDVPGNAQRARARLHERYGPEIRGRLLAALGSDDAQQAIQSAYLLAVRGESREALARAPDILTRAARLLAQDRVAGFRWVAAEAVVRLGEAMPPSERDETWSGALEGVDPWDLDECVSDLHQVGSRSGKTLPEALMRRYLRNLMHDAVPGNAVRCRYVLRTIGASAAPFVRDVLSGYDQQARGLAVDLLLAWGQEVPVGALAAAIRWSDRARERILAEPAAALPHLLRSLRNHDPDVVMASARAIVEAAPRSHDAEVARAMAPLMTGWRREAACRVLQQCGPAAEAALRLDLDAADPAVSLAAAQGLLALDAVRHRDAVLARVVRELRDDDRRENAQRACRVLLEVGDEALPALRALLDSDSEQAVVCAGALLARLGRLDEPTPRVLDVVSSYAARGDAADEPGALLELLSWSEPCLKAVRRRLELLGGSQGAALDVRMQEQARVPWLTTRR